MKNKGLLPRLFYPTRLSIKIEGQIRRLPDKRSLNEYTYSKTAKYLSIITINVNRLNAPIKRHRVAELMREHDSHIFCLQETHLRTKDLNRLKVKSWKKMFHVNRQGKKAEVAILISDKIDFKTKVTKREMEGNFIILKGRTYWKI